MTLLTAIVVGVLTGLFVNDKRRRLWITGGAVAVMLPIQSFVSPLWHKPGFSLSDPTYWGVQPFILGFGLLITTGVAYLRHRNSNISPAPQDVEAA